MTKFKVGDKVVLRNRGIGLPSPRVSWERVIQYTVIEVTRKYILISGKSRWSKRPIKYKMRPSGKGIYGDRAEHGFWDQPYLVQWSAVHENYNLRQNIRHKINGTLGAVADILENCPISVVRDLEKELDSFDKLVTKLKTVRYR